MKTPVFKGACVAIATPMTESGINYPELSRLIEFQIAGGIDAITICGTTGESSTMTDDEHMKAIEFCVEVVAGRVPVIAGTGSNDTAYALNLSKHACEAGADALLMVTPYYNKTTQLGLVRHYNYIADHVTKPIIIYNVPSRTGLACSTDTYRELSKHPMINGVKEASGNFTSILDTRYLCGDDLNIWSGNDDQIVPILSLGGMGVISVLANVLPKETHDIVQLYFDGKIKESSDLQIRYADLISRLFIEVNPIPVKTALNLMGFKAGPLRMPLCDMLPKNLEALKTSMRNAGISF